MAQETKTITRCDVFGTIKGVERYGIKVYRMLQNGQDEQEVYVELYLGSRALERLRRFLKRGTTAPTA